MRTHRQGFLWLVVAVAACGGGSGPGQTPSQITASAGENQIGPADQALAAPLEVTVKDASGAPVGGVSVTWAAASGGGSVTPITNTTAADGKATASRTLGSGAGPQTTTATVSGIAPVTFHHVAQIHGATQITTNSGAGQDTVLSTHSFSAIVRDQNLQVVAGVIVTWSLASGSGTLSQLVDTTDAFGLTSVDLTLDSTAGQRLVHAAVTGLQGSPVVFGETGVAGNATQMTLSSGGGQAGPVGGVIGGHAVLVRDKYNNPKSGVTVTWIDGDGAGSVSSHTPNTDVTGVATITKTLGSVPGVNTDTAVAIGLAGSPISFKDTAGPVDTIEVRDNFFSPVHDTVAVGTFLRYRWLGVALHSVSWLTAPPPGTLPPSSTTQSTGTFLVRITRIGTYTYECGIHGAAMPGDIVSQ